MIQKIKKTLDIYIYIYIQNGQKIDIGEGGTLII